jgi:hypothetical protein
METASKRERRFKKTGSLNRPPVVIAYKKPKERNSRSAFRLLFIPISVEWFVIAQHINQLPYYPIEIGLIPNRHKAVTLWDAFSCRTLLSTVDHGPPNRRLELASSRLPDGGLV